MANVSGRPDARLTSSIQVISDAEYCLVSPSRSPMRCTTSITPFLRSARTPAMPASSSGSANVPGSGVPSGTVCRKLREVEKPSAPPSMASARTAAIAAMSPRVAGVSSRLRSPIT
jgi:hypothetical protein